MVLQPEALAALAVLAAALIAVRRTTSRFVRAVLRGGMLVVLLAWTPLIVSLWLPSSMVGDNPVGLGLAAWYGTYLGLILLLCGLLALGVRAVTGRR